MHVTKLFGALALTLGVLAPAPALAAPDRQACASAYTSGQEQRLERRYGMARASFTTCAQPACPPFMQAECTTWLAELDAAQPSVVVSARDAEDKDLRMLSVTIDGRAAPEALEGRAVALDPGAHEVVVETTTGRLTEKLVLREGERLRRVELRAAPASARTGPRAPVAPAPRKGGDTLAWVFGGVGVAALASFAAFSISGLVLQRDRETTCAPICPRSDVEAVKLRYLVADVSLGVGVLAAVGFGWVVVARGGPNPQVAIIRSF